MKIIWD